MTAIGGTPADQKNAAKAGEAAAEEQALMDHLRATGQFDKLRAMGGGGAGNAELQRYEDEIDDLRCELIGQVSSAEQFEEELLQVEHQFRMDEQKIIQLRMEIEEFKYYKGKVDYYEREFTGELEALKEEGRRMAEELAKMDEYALAIPDDIKDGPPGGMTDLAKKAIKKLTKLQKESRNRMDEIAKILKEREEFGMDDGFDIDFTGKGANDIRAMLQMQKKMKMRLKSKARDMEKMAEEIKKLKEKEKHNEKMRKNWQNQLKEMESEVLKVSQMHAGDRKRYREELEVKEKKENQLKTFIHKMTKGSSSGGPA